MENCNLTVADVEYRHRNKDNWRHKRACFLYLIQGKQTGLIKIGISESPEARLRTLQAYSPDVLSILKTERFPDYVTATIRERQLHRLFSTDHSHGEWFRPSILPILCPSIC